MRTLLIFFFVLLAFGTYAQQTKKGSGRKAAAKKTTTTTAKPADGPVIMKAYYGDLMEIELGGYAEKYADDQRVKDLGSMMVRDHRRTKIELQSIASQRNMNMPETMDTQHKAKVNELEKKKGADFDKQYVDMLVNDHAKDLAELRKSESQVKDGELKKFIPKAIALMQTHLNSAKTLQASLKK